MLVEEAAEVIQAVNKYKRAKDANNGAAMALAEEIADLENMLFQVKEGLFISSIVDNYRSLKILRLSERLAK